MVTADIPCFPPLNARAHETCSPGAPFFALVLAARLSGSAMWVRSETSTLQRWELIKNKAGVVGDWQVAWDDTRKQVQRHGAGS